ncbi:MAG: penicillin-binding transpeptidase domain-containing protein [Nitrospiria bacterium]
MREKPRNKKDFLEMVVVGGSAPLKLDRRIFPPETPKMSLAFPFFILCILVLLPAGSWARSERWGDSYEKTPLYLEEGAIRFRDFRPELKHAEEGRYVSRFEDGPTLTYTIAIPLQTHVKTYFERYKVPYGAFVAIDPKSGKILALVDHSTREPRSKGLVFRASYPAASIFKLVTAAAAIEKEQVTPETTISYRGEFNRLKPAYWRDNPEKDILKTTLADALASSNNVVFAKVGARWLDFQTLSQFGKKFLFNRRIPFESPIEISRMEIDDSEASLAKTAAGFGEVGLSPMHAALLGAAIANDGVMMRPYMVDFINSRTGEKIYECDPKPLMTTVLPETAAMLRDMMGLTVLKGTVQEVFQTPRLERSLRGIEIGGKTGSLRGKTPRGRVTWFVAMAPLDDPEIVVSAMIVNDPVWHIIAPQVAKTALAFYFESRNARAP